jgi:hypothetical protein
MAQIPPIYLVDSSGQQWLVTVTLTAQLQAVPVFGQNAVPKVYLNSVTDNSSWQVTVVGNPPPAGLSWGDLQPTSIAQGDYPTQLLLTAPTGVVYGMQVATVGPPILGSVANGILQTALPLASITSAELACNTPISTLATNVLSRVEDPTGIFWSQQFEVYTALVEAMNDMLLLVGRPTQTVSVPFFLVPNTVWQTVPKGVFLISDIQGPQAPLRKFTLFSYDYEQPGSVSSDWENDVSVAGPKSWAPVGMTRFIVHPACAQPQTVLLSGLAYPVAETNFPYTGAETVPFHHEFFSALEEYAAVYARLKESGAELQEALPMYQNYLTMAKRLTEIEDRRDPLVFSPVFGAKAGTNPIVHR